MKTVSELIEELKKYDPKTIVSTDGYEGGVTDAVNVSLVDVALNYNEESYNGEHEPIAASSWRDYTEFSIAERLVIGSANHKGDRTK